VQGLEEKDRYQKKTGGGGFLRVVGGRKEKRTQKKGFNRPVGRAPRRLAAWREKTCQQGRTKKAGRRRRRLEDLRCPGKRVEGSSALIGPQSFDFQAEQREKKKVENGQH